MNGELAKRERYARIHLELGALFVDLAKHVSLGHCRLLENSPSLKKGFIQVGLKNSLREVLLVASKGNFHARLQLSQVCLDFVQKKIRVGKLALFKESVLLVVGLIALAGLTLAFWLFNTLFRRPGQKRVSFFFGVPREKIQDLTSLGSFFEEKFPELLSELNLLEARANVLLRNFHACPNALIRYHLKTIRGGDIAAWLAAMVEIIRFLLFNPSAISLGRDLIKMSAIYWMDKKGLVGHIVLTDSNYNYQPVWINCLKKRKFVSSFIWYSINNVVGSCLVDGKKVFPPHFLFPLISCDRGYYWNTLHASWFSSFLPKHDIRISGPNIFEPERKIKKIPTKPVRLALFDVIPRKKSYWDSVGEFYVYYRTDVMRNFFQAILDEMSTRKNVEVFLKTKRSYEETYDENYFDMLKEMENVWPFFKVLSPNTKIYELLERCHCAIGIPDTSPVYVATQMGIKGIFYDPTGLRKPYYGTGGDAAIFCRNKEELRLQLSEF